ncbi:MAG: IS66 family insertion sequence element accessory protein TnpA [Bryobacteraceae bacterium]
MSAFCREHGVSDQSFYNWRKRLAGSGAVRFALVEASVPVTGDTATGCESRPADLHYPAFVGLSHPSDA